LEELRISVAGSTQSPSVSVSKSGLQNRKSEIQHQKMKRSMDKALTLRLGFKMLKKHYGPPALPPTTEPFELILCEKVA